MNPPPRPLHVLVVDDDEKVLRLMQLFLRQLGHTLETAIHGREALRLMTNSSFDLLIVDIQMPIMDGLVFTREVRKVWPWQEILFCTGFMTESLRQSARELGVRHMLTKPLSLNMLETALKQCADSRANLPADARIEELQHLGRALNRLRNQTKSSFEGRHFGRTLRDFSRVVFDLVACRAVAVLGKQGDVAGLHMVTHGPLPPDEVAQVSSACTNRFQFLSEVETSSSLRPVIRVVEPDPTEAERAGGGLRHFLVRGDSKPAGMITVWLPEGRVDGETNRTLLLAAHHLSTILLSLKLLNAESMHDSLTGLFNRRYLDESLDRLWANGENAPEQAGLLVIDMDHFKALNDSQGQDAGDEVLRGVGKLIGECVLKNEFGLRSGGDEFFVYSSRCSAASLDELGNRIRQRIRDLEFQFGGKCLNVTASLGYALGGSQGGAASLPQLIECGQEAVDSAKMEGGDRVVSWMEIHPGNEAVLPVHPVLVVDDDPQVHQLIRRILPATMYTITCASSVAEGMALLAGGARFDLLLTDLSLPKEDGTEMLRRSVEYDPDIVRVVISGNISKNTEVQLLHHGAFDVIQKPFLPVDFRKAVSKAIAHRSRRLRQARKE